MSEPRGPEMSSETKNERDQLTTEQIAGAAADRVAGEPRSFEAKERPKAGDRGEAAAQPIFPEHEASDLWRSWEGIQSGFVDEPRRAVEEADHLVASTMQRLAEMFSQERSRLEGQWDRGDDVSTEDLRLALQRYRAFFGRLLAV